MPGGRRYRVRVLAPFLPKQARAAVSRWPDVTEEDEDGPADVLIVTALPEEREAVLKKLPNARRLDPSEEDVRTYYLSKLPLSRARAEGAFYRVVVTDLVGMAQVNAALAANDAIRRWKPRALLLVGIAGGVEASGVALGDVLIAREVAYFGIGKATEAGMEYEVKMIPVDSRMGTAMNNFARADGSALITVPRPDEGIETMHFGPMATGDTVVADPALLKRYQGTTRKLIGVEMEAWGVAMAAFQASHPKRFFMIRAASDLADSGKENAEVRRWRAYACDVAASYAIGFLRSGPLPLPAPPRAARAQGAFTGGADAVY
jgi:nucleoside phosphorylase